MLKKRSSPIKTIFTRCFYNKMFIYQKQNSYHRSTYKKNDLITLLNNNMIDNKKPIKL